MAERKLQLLLGIGISSILVLSLLFAFGGNSIVNGYANGAVQQGTANNKTMQSPANESLENNPSANANQTNMSDNATEASSTNQTTTTSTSQRGNGNGELPTEDEWKNLTTFELFEKYPALEDLTSVATNNTTNNETTMHKPAESQSDNQTTQPSPSKNETIETANSNRINNNINSNNSINSNNNNNTYGSGNVNANISSNTLVNQQAVNNSSTNQTNLNYLFQLQNTVNSLNQSITDLRKEMVNASTSISIDNLVVNASGISSSNVSSSTGIVTASNETRSSAVDFSVSKRLTGDFKEDDYIVVGHFSKPAQEDQRQLQLKIPCDDDERPEMKLLVGSVPHLKEMHLGKAIDKASVDDSGDELVLSKSGEYCLYQIDLPSNALDAILVNDSDHTLKLGENRYYVTVTESTGQ